MEKIAILDFKGDGGVRLAQKIRELKVYCEVFFDEKTALNEAKNESVCGVIAVGGDFICQKPVLLCSDYDISESTLHNFLFTECKAKRDWSAKNFAKMYVEDLTKKLEGKSVLCALSGGVDSAVCAALLSRAVGDNLVSIFVNHGFMRKNEESEIREAFKAYKGKLIVVDAEQRFLTRVKGVLDPEKKRKIIGEEFIRCFEEEAKKLGHINCFVQGTIYPDVVESGNGKGKHIKSHHNVGGLPEKIDFDEIIEPLYYLFKEEVRELGRELGLPSEITQRQPFPGPGLAVRTLGELTKPRLDVLREADFIFRQEILNAGLAKSLNQYFVVLTGLKSTGIKNGARAYEEVVALRAVTTKDFVSAECALLPIELLLKISQRICSEVDGVGRVVYDITSKPPATIEWE